MFPILIKIDNEKMTYAIFYIKTNKTREKKVSNNKKNFKNFIILSENKTKKGKKKFEKSLENEIRKCFRAGCFDHMVSNHAIRSVRNRL